MFKIIEIFILLVTHLDINIITAGTWVLKFISYSIPISEGNFSFTAEPN